MEGNSPMTMDIYKILVTIYCIVTLTLSLTYFCTSFYALSWSRAPPYYLLIKADERCIVNEVDYKCIYYPHACIVFLPPPPPPHIGFYVELKGKCFHQKYGQNTGNVNLSSFKIHL